MCSCITQIVYGCLVVVIIGLTATSLFTSSWRVVNANSTSSVSTGLFSCSIDYKNITNEFCQDWFDKLSGWERTTVCLMFVALIAEVIAAVYNFFTICACCCKQWLLHILSAISVVIIVALAAAIIVFGVNNQDAVKSASGASDVTFGYSFYLAIGALALSVVNTLIASLAICFADHCI